MDAELTLDAHLLLLEALACLPPDAWRPPVAEPRVRRALDVLRGHSVDPPSNGSLAAALDLHPASLVRLFRDHVGVTPQRWALLRRLDGRLRRSCC